LSVATVCGWWGATGLHLLLLLQCLQCGAHWICPFLKLLLCHLLWLQLFLRLLW